MVCGELVQDACLISDWYERETTNPVLATRAKGQAQPGEAPFQTRR
jgi:hypothetical protein